jgi:hypothetical protein
VTTNELAAAAGEDWRAADQPCVLLLAALGRESFDQAALRKRAVQDRGTTITSGVGEPPSERISVSREAAVGKVSEARVEGGPVSGFGILRRGTSGPFRGPWMHLALQTRLTIAFSGGQAYVTDRTGSR